MNETQTDHITFITTAAADGRRFFLSVDAGEGLGKLEEILGEGRQWIEVDDGQWINRDQVLYAYVTTAGDESRLFVESVG